jgi:hypothetical protein
MPAFLKATHKFPGEADLPQGVSVIEGVLAVDEAAASPPSGEYDTMFENRFIRGKDWWDKTLKDKDKDPNTKAGPLARTACLLKYAIKVAGSATSNYSGNVPTMELLRDHTIHPTKYDPETALWEADVPFVRGVSLADMNPVLKVGVLREFQQDKTTLLMPVLSAKEAAVWHNKQDRAKIIEGLVDIKKFGRRKWVVIDGAHRRALILSPECLRFPGYWFNILTPDCPFNVIYYLASSANCMSNNSSTQTTWLAKVEQARYQSLIGVNAARLVKVVDMSWGGRSTVYTAYAVGQALQLKSTWAMVKLDMRRSTPLWPQAFWTMPMVRFLECDWLQRLVAFVDGCAQVAPLPPGTTEAGTGAAATKSKKSEGIPFNGGAANLRGAWGGRFLPNLMVAATFLLQCHGDSLELDATDDYPWLSSVVPPKKKGAKKGAGGLPSLYKRFRAAVEECQAQLDTDDEDAVRGNLNTAAALIKECADIDLNSNWRGITAERKLKIEEQVRGLVERMPDWTHLRQLAQQQQGGGNDAPPARAEGLDEATNSLLLTIDWGGPPVRTTPDDNKVMGWPPNTAYTHAFSVGRGPALFQLLRPSSPNVDDVAVVDDAAAGQAADDVHAGDDAVAIKAAEDWLPQCLSDEDQLEQIRTWLREYERVVVLVDPGQVCTANDNWAGTTSEIHIKALAEIIVALRRFTDQPLFVFNTDPHNEGNTRLQDYKEAYVHPGSCIPATQADGEVKMPFLDYAGLEELCRPTVMCEAAGHAAPYCLDEPNYYDAWSDDSLVRNFHSWSVWKSKPIYDQQPPREQHMGARLTMEGIVLHGLGMQRLWTEVKLAARLYPSKAQYRQCPVPPPPASDEGSPKKKQKRKKAKATFCTAQIAVEHYIALLRPYTRVAAGQVPPPPPPLPHPPTPWMRFHPPAPGWASSTILSRKARPPPLIVGGGSCLPGRDAREHRLRA